MNKTKSTTDVVERLIISRKYIEERLEHERKVRDLPIDQVTGQEFFKPVIMQGIVDARRPKEIPIGDFLYKLKKKSYPEATFPHKPVDMESKSRSSKILQKAKIERYFEIFQQLSPDSDGEISVENINVGNVEDEVLRVIQPLLEELESIKQKLNFADFCEAMDNLCRTLSNMDKSVITIRKRQNVEEEEVMPSRRKSNSVTNFEATGVYDRHLKCQEYTHAKIENLREIKTENEVDGCTFRPHITPYNPSRWN